MKAFLMVYVVLTIVFTMEETEGPMTREQMEDQMADALLRGDTFGMVLLAQKCTELWPNYFYGYQALGKSYEQLNKTQQAIDAYREAIRLGNHNSDRLRTRLLNSRGQPREERKRIFAEYEWSEKNLAFSCKGLAKMRCEQGQYEKAEALLETARKIDPTVEHIWWEYAELKKAVGEIDQAIKYWHIMLNGRLLGAAVWHNLVPLYLEQGRTRDAIHGVKERIAKFGIDTYSAASLLVSLAMERRYEEALEAGLAAIAEFPDIAEFYGNTAYVLNHLDRFSEAISYAKTAISIEKNSAYYTTLGSAYLLSGRLEEAATALLEAITCQWDDLYAWCTLGRVYREQGNEQKYLEVFDHLLKEDLAWAGILAAE